MDSSGEEGIFDENEIYPYITEGIGEDILPKNVDFDIIDGFTKVTDKDAAVFTRKLAKEEGIFVGNSAGSAIKGVLQLKLATLNPEKFTAVLNWNLIDTKCLLVFFILRLWLVPKMHSSTYHKRTNYYGNNSAHNKEKKSTYASYSNQ